MRRSSAFLLGAWRSEGLDLERENDLVIDGTFRSGVVARRNFRPSAEIPACTVRIAGMAAFFCPSSGFVSIALKVWRRQENFNSGSGSLSPSFRMTTPSPVTPPDISCRVPQAAYGSEPEMEKTNRWIFSIGPDRSLRERLAFRRALGTLTGPWLHASGRLQTLGGGEEA